LELGLDLVTPTMAIPTIARQTAIILDITRTTMVHHPQASILVRVMALAPTIPTRGTMDTRVTTQRRDIPNITAIVTPPRIFWDPKEAVTVDMAVMEVMEV